MKLYILRSGPTACSVELLFLSFDVMSGTWAKTKRCAAGGHYPVSRQLRVADLCALLSRTAEADMPAPNVLLPQ